MVKLQIDIPEEFWKEEVRCGYRVSAEMKKVWAVQLDLLHELDRVCRKYSLRYFADSGTLIGVVRHKGYIPWDDDIDLVMMREDYELLRKVAAKEFRHPYFLQTLANDTGLIREHAQFRNSETTGYMPNEEDRPYNKGLFIDIFPMDVIPDEGPQYRAWLAAIRFLWRTIEYGAYVRNAPHRLKGRLFAAGTDLLYKHTDYKQVFAAYEKLCARYNGNEKFHRISYIAYSRGREKLLFEREWFEGTVMMPFEFTQIPVPSGYDARLTKEYGDYMVMKNIPSTHGESILCADMPYQEYIRKKKEGQNG